MRRVLRLLWLLLVGVQLSLGVAWLAKNVDTIPDYGDTGEYIDLARSLKVDSYRGIGYPAFIAAVNRLPGGAGLLRPAGRGKGTRAKAGVVYLQAIQLAASLAALAYFLRVFAARLAPEGASPWRARGPCLLLLALLLLDPLVAHFGLSIMTDSLALAASLAFCAALAHLGLGRRRRLLAGVVLFASFVACASLRVEKLVVMSAATLATLAGWLIAERRLPREERGFSVSRALQVAGVVLVGVLVARGLHGSVQEDGRRWPVYDSIVHSRIVFPNLTAVYDQLPEKIRSRISPREARRHDSNSIVGYRVINDAAGDSGPIRVKDRREVTRGGVRPSVERERRAMLEEMAGIVLRERWALLAADALKDALENVAATGSFYVRLAVLARTGQVSSADGTKKTYDVLSQAHPRLSRAYLISSAALLVASLAPALAALRRRRGAGPALPRRAWLAWVPVAAFVVVNGAAFALRADMVHIRYMLLAHAAFLVLVFRGALDWLLPGREAPPPAAPGPA